MFVVEKEIKLFLVVYAIKIRKYFYFVYYRI